MRSGPLEAVETGKIRPEVREALPVSENDNIAAAQDGTIARLIEDVQAGQVRGEMRNGIPGIVLEGSRDSRETNRILDSHKASDIIKEIKAIGIQGKINLNPQYINIDELDFDNYHINNERQHNVAEQEAKLFITQAKISTTTWNGRFENFYGEFGCVYVDVINKKIRTAYKKDEFTENIIRLMEVLSNYEK